MTRPPLSHRQRQILAAIRTSLRERGYSPSTRELCATVGVRSTSTVSADVHALRAAGYIEVLNPGPAKRGFLRLIDPVHTCPTCQGAGVVPDGD